MLSLLLNGITQVLQLPTHVLFLLVFGLCLGQQYHLHPRTTQQGRIVAIPIATLVLSVMFGLLFNLQSALLWSYAYALWLLLLTLLVGGCVILQWRMAFIWLVGISSIGGLLLGITAEPLLLPSFSAEKISSIFAGITIGAGLLSVSVTLLAGVLQQWWQGLGVRILGSWITACTLLVLALHWFGHKLPVS